MSQRFSSQLAKTIESYLTRYETKRSSILPILHAVQDERDWISDKDVEELEKSFGLSAVEIREVLTFYTMYRKHPPKPYRFDVCISVSCWLEGSQKTIEAIQERLDVAEKAGMPLPFEVHPVECLNVCGYAPVALINKDRHLNVTPALALQLIEDYLAKELPEAAKNCARNLQSEPAHA